VANLLIKVVYLLLVSTWPIVAGLIGFAIVAIADSAGNGWALAATICITIATLAMAVLGDLADPPRLEED
jgi:hypothetical protein